MSADHETLWERDEPDVQVAWDEHTNRLTEHQQAVEARDRGIEKAEKGSNPLWVEEALTAVKALARVGPELTSEDVADLLELSTPEPRALGPILLVAKNKGWIAPTSRFVPARHPSRHMAPIRVWASKIFVWEKSA